MWEIGANEVLCKKLAKLNPNSDAARGFRVAVANLAQADDPARMGERKHGRLRHLYSYRITKSIRLLYFIDRSRSAITLVNLDDQKNVYAGTRQPRCRVWGGSPRQKPRRRWRGPARAEGHPELKNVRAVHGTAPRAGPARAEGPDAGACREPAKATVLRTGPRRPQAPCRAVNHRACGRYCARHAPAGRRRRAGPLIGSQAP